MSGNIKPAENNGLLVAVLGVVAALLIFAVLTNRPIPFISSERVAMIVLVVVGVAMCALGGIGPTIARFGWTSPVFIVGAALVLTDSTAKHVPAPGYESLIFIPPGTIVRQEFEHVNSWELSREVQPGVFVHDDYDLERPSVELRSRCGLSRTLMAAPRACTRSMMAMPSTIERVARSHSATTSTSPVPSASIARCP